MKKEWLILLTTVLTTTAHANGLQGTTSEHISYATGGIGANEVATIRSMANQYNTHLTFAEKYEGHHAFITDVDTIITNEAGVIVFQNKHTGPYLYLNLPAGKYLGSAEYEGKPKQFLLEIKPNTTENKVFIW